MFLIKTQRFRASLFVLLSVSLLLACFAFLTTSVTPAHALTTVPTTMNFQGRLADSSGNIMPDGLYNMQFRLFTVGSGGSSVWNETRENNGTDYRVQVTNGLFSTKLGEVSPLSASLFASGSLYFEITMATPATATCSTASCASWESPMTPRHEMSTSAYAYNAETLDGFDSSYFATATGATGYIQNTTTPQTADFNITGTGTANILRASTFDRASAGTLTIGGTNATSISLADDTSVASGKTLRVVGDTYTNIDGYPSPTEGQITYDQTNDQLLVYNATLGKWMSDKSDAILVAASNSSQADKNAADYVADGEDSSGSGIGTLDGDQIEINQALTAAAGKKVVLLAGTYTIDASISVPNNTTLAGVGAGTVIQLGNFGATSVTFNAITNTDTTTGTGVVIQDLKLDGRRSINTAGTQHAIYWWGMGGGNGATARKGGYLNNVYAISFKDRGISLYTSSNNIISGSTAQGNGSYGIYLSTNSDNNTVTGNIAQGNSNYGIVTHASSNNTVTGNTSQGNSIGIGLSSSTKTAVSGNTVKDSGNSGIYIATSSDNSITGNTFQDNGSSGIYLVTSTDNTITSNISQGNASYGIFLTTSANSNSISSNTVQNNTIIGIILDASTNNSITSNTITSNTSDGLVLINGSSNNSVTGNTSQGNVTGIALSTSSNNNTISGNTAQSNTGNGIYLISSSSNSITGNIAQDNTDNGIYVYSSSHNNTISGNTAQGNTDSGIYISSSHYNIISNNGVHDNEDSIYNNGIRLANSDSNSITGNTITDTSATLTNYAINFSYGGSANYIADNVFSSTSGTSTINDQATGTVYSNQPTAENGGNVTTKSTQASTYVTTIQNASTATTADGLLISLGVANASRTTGNYFVGFASGTSVAGKIQGGSNVVAYTTSGADYAEYFKADPQAMPQSGELVMLDASNSQSVVRTNGNTQRPLAGIVSTNPGFIGNGPICDVDDEDCDANYAKYNALVALSGQVPTKVNTSNGAIAIGDPIMASNVAGEGAKATSAGHIVGYALEALSSGSGTIEVLVRPQHYAPAISQLLQATDLTLTGQASISGSLNVSGPTTLASLTVTDAVTIKGKLTVDTIEAGSITVNGHIVTKGSAPTIAVGDAAGTGLAGDESTNPQAVVDGTDSAGTVTVTAGAENMSSGVLAKITFADVYEADVKVVVSASNESASEVRTYTVKTATGFEIVAKDQLQAGAEYAFDYIVQGVKVVP